MGPGGHELSLGTTWKERGVQAIWLPRVRGAGEDLIKSISSVPVGGSHLRSPIPRLCQKAWLPFQSHQEALARRAVLE